LRRTNHAETCYSKRPERALERLVLRDPADCWLIRLSTLPKQQWFEEHDVPALLAGTAYPGVNLPYVDIDQGAVSRHAAGLLVGPEFVRGGSHPATFRKG